MKARKLFLVLAVAVAVLSTGLVPALGQTAPAAPPTLPDGETAIVRVYYPDDATRISLFLSFEPQVLETNYRARYHVMQVTQSEIDRLAALGLRIQLDTAYTAPPVTDPLPQGITTIPSYPCYRTVEETYAAAQALVTNHPTLASWVDIGDTWLKYKGQGGYDMMVLKLTNSAVTGDKPDLFIMGSIHAREYTPAETATRFGEYLVNNYGTDPDATWLLDHHEIHLMLQSNPDGRKKAETGLSWRKNVDNDDGCTTPSTWGTDLNRNYVFKWGCCGGSSGSPCNETYRGPSAGSEPETQAAMTYMASIFPDQRGPGDTDPAPADATGIYIDLHSYSELVLWPWGWTSTNSPNATQLQTLGRKLAYFNSYTPQKSYSLYATDGTTDDHAYGIYGVASYCIEMGTSFFQSCTTFENTIYPNNLQALLYAAKVVRTPYMTPLGPDALSLVASPASVPAGDLAALTATINDTRYRSGYGEPTQNIAAAEYYVDTPPWVTGAVAHSMAASDGSFNSTIEGVTATVDTAGLSTGKHLLFVRGKDANDNWGAFSAVFLTITEPGTPTPTPTPTDTPTPGPTPTFTPTPTETPVPSGDTIWMSLSANATLGSLGTVNDEDIVALNPATGVYTWIFDGSDVGITTDIDAFDVLDNGHILMSFDGNTPVSGVGTVADADVVEFTPTSLGSTTAGTFTWKFDGSDVGLSSGSEDVDALFFLGDGTMLVSIRDAFSVTGISGQDEDLVRFTATSWGSATAGTWNWYFDGSDVGLATNANEDVDGIWLDTAMTPYPYLYLNTLGSFSVPGISGANEDILIFKPTALGSTTAGTYNTPLYLDGSLFGLASYDIDAFDVQR